MNTTIAKGTKVILETTNGGRSETTLLEKYRPTFSATCGQPDGSVWFIVEPERIKSITPVSEADIPKEIQTAQSEIVVTVGEYQFTREELETAFNQVAPKDQWKNPICAYAVFRSPRERIAMHAAVPFFTGSTPTLEFVGTAGDTSAYKVVADGYYKAVGA